MSCHGQQWPIYIYFYMYINIFVHRICMSTLTHFTNPIQSNRNPPTPSKENRLSWKNYSRHLRFVKMHMSFDHVTLLSSQLNNGESWSVDQIWFRSWFSSSCNRDRHRYYHWNWYKWQHILQTKIYLDFLLADRLKNLFSFVFWVHPLKWRDSISFR